MLREAVGDERTGKGMVEIEVVYPGELRSVARHVPSDATLTTDAPKDNEGRGESFSPTDLLATSLCSCMLTVMGIVARKRGWKLDGARARVEKHMVADPLRRVGRLPVRIEMPRGLPAEARPVLEKAALTCPVHLSVNPSIDRPVTFVYPD
jgi:putative redox protein